MVWHYLEDYGTFEKCGQAVGSMSLAVVLKAMSTPDSTCVLCFLVHYNMRKAPLTLPSHTTILLLLSHSDGLNPCETLRKRGCAWSWANHIEMHCLWSSQ